MALGIAEDDAAAVVDMMSRLESALPDPEGVNVALGQLPRDVHLAILNEMAADPPIARAVRDVEAFASHEVGAALLDHWGADAERKLGRLQARFDRLVARVGPEGDAWLSWFLFEAMTPQETAIVLDWAA